MQIFKRRNENGVWTYSDNHEHSFACECVIFYGFDLPEFDSFLESPIMQDEKAKPSFENLLECRKSALSAFVTDNHEAVRAWLNFLFCARRHILREEYTVPLAKHGKKHRETQSLRRKDKPGTDGYIDPRRNERIRNFHSNLMANNDSDATSQTATEFKLSTRQVRRIVNGNRT